jgi:hypothetical protein
MLINHVRNVWCLGYILILRNILKKENDFIFGMGGLNFRISFQIFRLFLGRYYAIPTTTFYADDDVGCTWYYAMHTTNISILNLSLFFPIVNPVCCRL